MNLKRISLLVATLTACDVPATESSPDPSEASQAITYGVDDRRDVFEVEDEQLRELVRSSVVALVPPEKLERRKGGEVRPAGATLKDAFDGGLCEGERFAHQEAAAECTGVLIGTNLVATAGHCFESTEDCDRYAYVFDYYYREPNRLEAITSHDVYGCRRIVSRRLSESGSEAELDYALVELDRVPTGRQPVAIRTDPLEPGTWLTTIGTPSGLPLKVDQGASVLVARPETLDFFTLDSDTFEGSSGSGVFDDDGRLAGILVRGGSDYEPDPERNCIRVRTLASADEGVSETTPLPGEQATYAARLLRDLCATGFSSPTLCGSSSRCGDRICSSAETHESCPEDCSACTNATCRQQKREPGDAVAEGQAPMPKRLASHGCSLGGPKTAGLPGLWYVALMLVCRGLSRRRRPPLTRIDDGA